MQESTQLLRVLKLEAIMKREETTTLALILIVKEKITPFNSRRRYCDWTRNAGHYDFRADGVQ
jgi:hypothetical protein